MDWGVFEDVQKGANLTVQIGKDIRYVAGKGKKHGFWLKKLLISQYFS